MVDMESIKEKTKTSRFGRFVLSSAMTAAAHPLTYVKVLIQVGHEPIPPQQTTTFFGKKVMRLPNFLQYASHIRQTDGWIGLYRGLGPRVLYQIVSSTVTNMANNKIKAKKEAEDIVEADENDLTVKNFLHETGNLAMAQTAGIIVSYPFHVISIRMMVQFVGKETHYRNIFTSFNEIYQEDGILGFFSGLVPYLLGELFGLWMYRTLNFLAQKYILDQEQLKKSEMRTYVQGVSQYIAGMVTYPFELVTNIMAVNDTRLVAGNPPLMPIYESWTECWVELGKKGLRGRGSTLFRRTISS